MPGQCPDIVVVHPDFARPDIIKAHQQVDDGGFSGAGGTDDGDEPSRGGSEG